MSSDKPKPNPDALAQLVNFLNDSNGRDKFSKTLQYGCRLIAWYYLSADPKSETGLRFKGLFEVARDSRKLPRLLKWLNEFQTMAKVVSTENPSNLSYYIKLISRMGWANYWLFDNLGLLNKAKFTKIQGDLGYWANSSWSLGLTCEIILKLQELSSNFNKVTEMTRQIYSTQDEKERDSTRKERAKLLAQRQKIGFELLANICDLVCALNGAKLIQTSEASVSISGTVSAVIGGYYRWKALNP